jgi:hypothetical protein
MPHFKLMEFPYKSNTVFTIEPGAGVVEAPDLRLDAQAEVSGVDR